MVKKILNDRFGAKEIQKHYVLMSEKWDDTHASIETSRTESLYWLVVPSEVSKSSVHTVTKLKTAFT